MGAQPLSHLLRSVESGLLAGFQAALFDACFFAGEFTQVINFGAANLTIFINYD